MKLTVKALHAAHGNRDHAIIIKTFDKYVKMYGLDRFEAKIDCACLEIAEKLGYIYERENDELIFIQRGL